MITDIASDTPARTPTGRQPRRRWLAAGLLASAAIASAAIPAYAGDVQSAADDQALADRASGIADIVITAQRRAQDLQKASLTVQVLGADDVLKAGLSAATDLNKLTTGVEIGQGGGYNQVFIRGVGGFAFSPISDPGVAFNVDGVYVGRPNGLGGNFYDIARVEILKGPQGTLYGRNANGGSINVITNEPTLGERSLNLDFEGGNYSLIHASGAINLPVGNTLAIRGAWNVIHRDGYLSNGGTDDIQQSGRLRVKWEPGPDVTLLLNADYSHLGGKGVDYVYKPRRPGASPYEAVTEPEANDYMRTFGPLAPLIDDQIDDGRQDTHLYNLSAQLDWRLGDFATLTLLPAYRHVKARYVVHEALRFEGIEKTNQTSVEARLSNNSERLNWVVGAYYFNEKSPDAINNVFVSDILQNYHIVYSPKTDAYAAFANGTLTLVDGLRLIAGGRYTWEKRRLTGSITDMAVNPPAILEIFGGAKNFGGFTYKLGAEYDITPSNMVYLTYSTGFKSGGLSQTVAPLNVYNPEKLYAWEFGSRNRFFDNQLQLNFGAFHWKYKNMQDQRLNFDPLGNVNFLTLNSGTATLYGATFDMVAQPTMNDRFSLQGEYTHARYDNFYFQTPVPFYQPGSTGCVHMGPYGPGETLPYTQPNGSNVNDGPFPVLVDNCSGFQMARVPKWTGIASYSHTFDLRGGATLVATATGKYSSARWIAIDFVPSQRDGSYGVLDADLTYTSADGNVSVSLFGRNLTKSVYYTAGVQPSFAPGLLAANIAPPRTYGVRASFRFSE